VRIVQATVDTKRLLARLAEQPAEAAIILDVDGTLAPIVPRPEDAVVPDETRGLLEQLVRRYALVACVSGRSGEDAAAIVGVEGVVYVGEHGLELDPRADEWAPAIAAFADSVEWPAERKPLTVSFHFRAAEDEQAALTELRGVADRAIAAGLRPRWGRKVLEVRPPLDADKGTAIRLLLDERRLRRALYAGDDATDLDAFRGLDELELAVRVAVVSAEAPTELGAAADVVVGGPEALADLLRLLV
jgi:trehalose 6-phosphate phosphatase